MNDVRLIRIFRGEKYTIGELYVNREYVCDTLEPIDMVGRGEVYQLGRSAVPVGHYTLDPNVWSPRFDCAMPRIMDFAYSKNILIHWGNTPQDTEGCILVGQNTQVGKVLNSRDTWKRLMALLCTAKSWKLHIY